MMQYKRFVAAPALVVLMSGTAHAALTADQVWDSWKAGADHAGIAISAADQQRNGDALVLNNVVVGLKAEGAAEGLKISTLTLTETNGEVVIVPGTITLDEGEGTDRVQADVAHQNWVITAKEGSNGGVVYDYSADVLTVNYNVQSAGYAFDETQEAAPVTSSGSISFDKLAGSYSDTPGTNRAFAFDIAADALKYSLSNSDANMGTNSVSDSQTVDFKLKSLVTLPSAIKLEAAFASAAGFGTALQEGLAISVESSQGVSTGVSKESSEFMPYELTMSSEPSETSFSFDKSGLAFDSSAEGLTILANSEMLPGPAEIKIGASVLKMLTPVMTGDKAEPYAFTMTLAELSISDSLWNMIDGAGALKRDPLDLNIDVSGALKIDMPAMVEAEAEGQPEVMPQPESLDIKDLSLKVAGAALQASGAFTFDHSMGVPAPLGQANVLLTGSEQLLNGLVANGILSEDDVSGARMMMAAFMEKGPGEDSLQSKIEAKEGMQIFVNGQQIQ